MLNRFLQLTTAKSWGPIAYWSPNSNVGGPVPYIRLLSTHYLGVHVLARPAAACLVCTSPSAHRRLRTSRSVHQQLIPTCEDHTSTGSSTRTKQTNHIGLTVTNQVEQWDNLLPSIRVTNFLNTGMTFNGSPRPTGSHWACQLKVLS